jgi:hypothetical protein
MLNAGGSLSSAFDFTYNFANTDSYRLEGTVFAYQQPDEDLLGVSDFIVTYLGNSSGTVSGNDALTSEFLQEYPRHEAGIESYFEKLDGTFGPGLGLASSASATFGENGHLTPSLGPVLSPPTDFDVSKSGTIYLPPELPELDYAYTLDFGQGSSPGSSITLYPTTAPPVTRRQHDDSLRDWSAWMRGGGPPEIDLGTETADSLTRVLEERSASSSTML